MGFGLGLIERETFRKDWMKDYEFVLIQTIDHLKEVIERAIKAPYCAFDLESTGLDTRIFNGKSMCQVVGYSIAFEEKTCYYLPIRHKVETDRGVNLPIQETNVQIQKLLLEAVIVGHNWLKFDAEMMLASDGLYIKKFKQGESITYHDSYYLARLAGFKPAGLKTLSEKLLNKEMISIKEVVASKKDIDFGSISPYEGCIYAASDAICTKELFEHPEIQAPLKDQAFIYNVERKLSYVVRKLERNKIKLNIEHCRKLNEELNQKIKEVAEAMFDILAAKTEGKLREFKVDSVPDVSHILFSIFDMNPKPEKGKNGNYKTDDATLELLAPNYEFAKILQEYRTLTKFQRTYTRNMINNVDKDGYLKFQFRQLQTDTGRFASPGGGKNGDGCSGVNIQSTPARYDKSKPNVRKCISCEDDEVIVAMDWSGIEIRVAANMSKEPIWLDRFVNGDGDVHTSTAAIIYDKPESEVTKAERQNSKCVHPDSLIFVNGKYQRIGDLHQGREKDTFYNLSSESNVLVTRDKTERIAQFYSNGEGETLLVCTRRGIIACSKKHSFELEDGTLVAAEKLEKGMVMKEVPFGISSTKHIEKIYFNPFLKSNLKNDTLQININNDISYFAGLFLGDGSTSINGSFITSGSYGKYLEWQNIVKASLNKVGLDCTVGKVPYIVKGEARTAVSLYFGSRHTNSILNELELIDPKVSKKIMKVPSYVLNGSKEVRMSFLAGFLDADGTVTKYASMSLTQKSWTVIQDCCVLLASLGFHYSLEISYNKTYERYYYRIRIAKKHNLEFKKYMKCFWKTERLEDAKIKNKTYPKNRVTLVLPLGENPLVDVEIDSEEHMYLVNNHRTHNTVNFQSIYGGSYYSLATALGIEVEDAKIKQGKFFGRLSTLKNYIRTLQKFARSKEYCLTKFGRKRMLPEYQSEFPKVQRGADRKATNTPIQGTAADLLKLAMIKVNDYLEENNLDDVIKMIITMHDELVFRVKKTHVDKVKEIEEIMKLDPIIKKIKWEIPLAVDIEIGDSWDIHYEYNDMLDYLKEKYGADSVTYLYKEGMVYDEVLNEFNIWLDAKKEAKKAKGSEPKKEVSSKEDFKKMGNAIAEKKNGESSLKEASEKIKEIQKPNITPEVLKAVKEELAVEEEKVVEPIEKITEDIETKESSEEISSLSLSASPSELDNAFKILQNANLGDLPLEAHTKLKKSFYEEEFKRILSGEPSASDEGIELSIIVHNPIDDAKKNSLSYIIDSCPGQGKVRFLSQDREELHEGWVQADILKVAVMSKVQNL